MAIAAEIRMAARPSSAGQVRMTENAGPICSSFARSFDGADTLASILMEAKTVISGQFTMVKQSLMIKMNANEMPKPLSHHV
jgi:hypothetical protein